MRLAAQESEVFAIVTGEMSMGEAIGGEAAHVRRVIFKSVTTVRQTV